MNPPRFEFFFDLNSPYSYLAATQLPALEQRLGLNAHWRPFLLGAAFKDSGNRSPASVPAKARWMLSDLQQWAALYQVPLNFPSWFPGNSLSAMRACVAAFMQGDEEGRRFTMSCFQAAWVDNVDLSVPEALLECANLAGLPGRQLVEATYSQEVKDILKNTTDEAVRRGVFGAPTFFVDNQLFWGNDRMVLVEYALHARLD